VREGNPVQLEVVGQMAARTLDAGTRTDLAIPLMDVVNACQNGALCVWGHPLRVDRFVWWPPNRRRRIAKEFVKSKPNKSQSQDLSRWAELIEPGESRGSTFGLFAIFGVLIVIGVGAGIAIVLWLLK
jgi:hypothetical protein